jgi:hypothetical protein
MDKNKYYQQHTKALKKFAEFLQICNVPCVDIEDMNSTTFKHLCGEAGKSLNRMIENGKEEEAWNHPETHSDYADDWDDDDREWQLQTTLD